ncbi:MAG: FtsB family cell division protein [Acidimicrobiales bacterium]
MASGAGLVLYLGFVPARAIVDQSRERDRLAVELARLNARQADLDARARLLRSDDEIDRLARVYHHLVRPGEEAYVVIPGPSPDSDPLPRPDPDAPGPGP